MARYADTLADQYGRGIGGALVVVAYSTTGGLAALTADGGAALSNPFLTNPDGTYVFNTADGAYDLTYRFGGRVIGKKLNQFVGVAVPIATDVTQVLAGMLPFGLPDEAKGQSAPAAGSGLPYLSGGVLKVA